MTMKSVFNDLCRYPQWQIDNIIVEGDTVRIVGWALPFHEDYSNVDILLNGNRPIDLKWGDLPGIEKIFPHVKNSLHSRFAATYKLVGVTSILCMSYVGIHSQDSFNRWTDIYFPISIWNEKTYITPEGVRLRRTQGDESVFRYVTYGFTVASRLELALQTYFGISMSNCGTICDWGVGCGRVAQMVNHFAPRSEFIGIDVDADNLQWCKRNLPFGRYETINLYPPTLLDTDSVDLIYGISVFSHLKLDAFTAWIDELARVLRPGGVALVTINGGAGLMKQGRNNAELIERVLLTGFDDGSRDGALTKVIEDQDYYRGTFVMHSRATAMFSEKFKVRDILRQANGASQDMLVCEKL